MAKRKKPHGHYCKVCGIYRANEKFSGKGHAAHICKDCAKLSPAQRAEEMTLNRLCNLPWYLSKEQIKWLKNRTHESRPAVREEAQEQFDMRFKREYEADDAEDDLDFDADDPDLEDLDLTETAEWPDFTF